MWFWFLLAWPNCSWVFPRWRQSGRTCLKRTLNGLVGRPQRWVWWFGLSVLFAVSLWSWLPPPVPDQPPEKSSWCLPLSVVSLLFVSGQQLWFAASDLPASVCLGFRLFIILKTLIYFIHTVILDDLPSCFCLSAESYLLHSIKCWLFNVPWVWRDLEKLHFLILWSRSSWSNVQRDLKPDTFRSSDGFKGHR